MKTGVLNLQGCKAKDIGELLGIKNIRVLFQNLMINVKLKSTPPLGALKILIHDFLQKMGFMIRYLGGDTTLIDEIKMIDNHLN